MKKILLICKETYSYPMNFVKDELVALGYEVEALFIHSSEALSEDITYTKFVERNKDIKIHSIQNICLEYIKGRNNLDDLIDYEYLEQVEKKYCEGIPISLLQVSSQLFTTPYHYRFYFRDMTEKEKLYWIQLLFKYCEKLLESSNYYKICDLDIAEIGRSILLQVSKEKNVPYVALEFSRYQNIVLPTYTLGRETDQYFVEYCKAHSNDVELKHLQEVDEFRKAQKIMNEDYRYNLTSKVRGNPFRKDLSRLVHSCKYIVTTIPDWFRYHKTPLLANPFKALWFFFLWFLRERLIFNKSFSLFENPIKGEKYVYFPLHLIPESTTLNKSPFYPNEISVIEAISKSLPVNCKLYVKEHGSMVGERPFAFYKRIMRLSNVRLVNLSFYDDPKPWITNSLGVITLSGTAAFEAAILNVPAIMLGSTFFESIQGIRKLNRFEDLPQAISEFMAVKKDNKLSVALYLQAIQNFGEKVKIIFLLNECAEIIRGDKAVTEEIKAEIKNIVKIYGLN